MNAKTTDSGAGNLLTSFHAVCMDGRKVLCQLRVPSIAIHLTLRKQIEQSAALRMVSETLGNHLSFVINSADADIARKSLEALDLTVHGSQISAEMPNAFSETFCTAGEAVSAIYAAYKLRREPA